MSLKSLTIQFESVPLPDPGAPTMRAQMLSLFLTEDTERLRDKEDRGNAALDAVRVRPSQKTIFEVEKLKFRQKQGFN